AQDLRQHPTFNPPAQRFSKASGDSLAFSSAAVLRRFGRPSQSGTRVPPYKTPATHRTLAHLRGGSLARQVRKPLHTVRIFGHAYRKRGPPGPFRVSPSTEVAGCANGSAGAFGRAEVAGCGNGSAGAFGRAEVAGCGNGSAGAFGRAEVAGCENGSA